MSYRVLAVDPPWQFGDKLPGPGRGADKHYPTLNVNALKAFPLPPIADNAFLFLWRVASMQEEALAVVRAWGFVVKSELVWVKRTVNGNRHFGMGQLRARRARGLPALYAGQGQGCVALSPQYLRGASRQALGKAGGVFPGRRGPDRTADT